VSDSNATSSGIGFGAALAIAISYAQWHSVGWAILHGLFSWIYVFYALFHYANWGAQ
jgi:hypothetical protein